MPEASGHVQVAHLSRCACSAVIPRAASTRPQMNAKGKVWRLIQNWLPLTTLHACFSVCREGPSLQHSPLWAGHRGIRHRCRRCRRHGHRGDSVCRLHLPRFRPGAGKPHPLNTLSTITWSALYCLDSITSWLIFIVHCWILYVLPYLHLLSFYLYCLRE